MEKIIWGTFLLISVSGAPVPLANPSFEDISGQPVFNEFTLVVPNGWSAYNPSNLVSGGGLYFGTLATDGAFFDPAPNPAPDGNRVAILYNQSQKGAGEYGMEQVLGATLQPYTRYTLEVAVGNIGSGYSDSGDFFNLSNFPGYRVELLAGTNVFLSDHNSLAIPERTFSNTVLQVVASADTPGIGEALTVRLVSLNQPLEPDDNTEPYDAHEVDFDHVRLDAEFMPGLFSTANGATHAVLIDAGLAATNASPAVFEAASMVNGDGDVHYDWQEYIAGTDPTNALSFFTNTLLYADAPVVQWHATSNRSYAVWSGTNVTAGLSMLTNGLTEGSFVDHGASNNAGGFYRVDVQLQ